MDFDEPLLTPPARDRVYRVLTDLARTGSVPALTPVAIAALKVAREPDPDPAEMCRIVETDVGLAARVLRLSNSYAYIRRTPAQTVREAVLTVGVQGTCNLVVAVCGQGLYRAAGRNVPTSWQHAVQVGIATRELARMTRQMEPDLAFLPGLFHDIGWIVFLAVDPVVTATIDARYVLGADYDTTLEQELFGFDHAQVGTMLAENWGLAPDQCAMIRWHHHGAASPNGSGVLINAAEALVHSIQPGADATAAARAAIALLGHSDEEVATLASRVLALIEEQQALLD
jgi:HD-like signal output (HDOD) protein